MQNWNVILLKLISFLDFVAPDDFCMVVTGTLRPSVGFLGAIGLNTSAWNRRTKLNDHEKNSSWKYIRFTNLFGSLKSHINHNSRFPPKQSTQSHQDGEGCQRSTSLRCCTVHSTRNSPTFNSTVWPSAPSSDSRKFVTCPHKFSSPWYFHSTDYFENQQATISRWICLASTQ